MAASLGLTEVGGVIVGRGQSGSAADKRGPQAQGDVIEAFNGQP